MRICLQLLTYNFKYTMKSDIIYSINKEDVQSTAFQEIGRELTDIEIEKIIDLIAEKMNWYDAIADAIAETIEEAEE